MLFLAATLLLPFALLARIARFVAGVVLFFVRFAAFALLRLKDSQIVVESIETLFPEPAIFLEPVIGFLEGARFDAARTHLCVARARDQARALENLQVPGNCRQTHVEWLGEFQHRCFAECEAREDGAPCRISEGCEGGAEAVAHRIKPSR